MLSESQRDRYSRQTALPEIGAEGQERLLGSRVLVVGAGGLGSPAAAYLAAAGVGMLGIADDDIVALSNLQRQILHGTADVGLPKAESAAATIAALNPDVTVRTHPVRLTASDGGRLVADYEFVIDATDNFESKFAIADVCHAARVRYSHAGISRFMGQTMTVIPGLTACYRCVFDAPPEPRESDLHPEGPLGPVPGVIGAIQATEAIKSLLGAGDLLTDRLLIYDALAMAFRMVAVKRSPSCPLCGEEAGDG
jgi:molybdopterin/thiamine biosynthesis adenylyltransferase